MTHSASVTKGLILILLLGGIFVTSCLSMGINFRNRTPVKASKLPHFTRKDSLAGYNGLYRSCYDVKHYDIHLTPDYPGKQLSGFVTSSFELITKSDRIQIDLDPQFIIDSITSFQKRLSFRREFSAVFVNLANDQQFQQITVYYRGHPAEAKRPPWEGGFVWSKDRKKRPWFGVACQSAGANTWLPVKAFIGDEPDSMDFYCTLPSGLTAVSNGVLADTLQRNGSTTWHWKCSYPINPYNITLYGGAYASFELPYETEDGTPMLSTFYVLPENLEKARIHFLQSANILLSFEKLFGSYPWTKDGYKLVESPYEGMEHQTAIAYGAKYKNEAGQDFDYIILHETAHEWWGNSVSVSDFADIWIHEGMATYAEALYVEQTKGYQAYLDYIRFQSIFIKNKKPVVGPAGVNYWNYKDGDPYNKGALMLHTLRNHLENDRVFFSILKAFYKKHRYGHATSKDFIELVNAMSGKNCDAFFAQYLFNRASPRLLWNFDVTPAGNKQKIVYKWERAAEGFSTPVAVEIGTRTFTIYPTDKIQEYELPFSPGKDGVRINSKLSYLENGYKGIKPGKKE